MFNSNIQSSIRVRYFLSIFVSIESSKYMTHTSTLAKMYVVEQFRMDLYIRTFADGLFLMMRIIMTRSFFRSFQLPFFARRVQLAVKALSSVIGKTSHQLPLSDKSKIIQLFPHLLGIKALSRTIIFHAWGEFKR